MSSQELVEEVDAHGEVLRVVTRAQVRAGGLRHRAVFVAVSDQAGVRVVVHRRADWKDVWPGYWDLAFGGIVGVGEAWDQAGRRELAEEAGVQADLQDLGGDAYDGDGFAEVARVFLARHDGPFPVPDGEVVEVAWVAVDHLTEWVSGHQVCPDSVAMVLPRILTTLGDAR